MADPLKRIPFSAAPYDVTLSTTDDRGTVYVGDHLIVPTQFGFFRLNAKTGEFVHRVGVTYQLGGLIPPGQVGTIRGDYHQPVSELVASDRWIVTNNTAPVDGHRYQPAAIVWRNDADATLHGVVESVRATPAWPQTFDLLGGVSAHLRGDLLYLQNSDGRCAVIDLVRLAWVGWQDTLPDGDEQHSIGGHTYRYLITNEPWASGTYGYREYAAVRSDVPVVSEPPPRPSPAPSQPQPAPQPPASAPPTEGDTTMPVDYPGAPPLGPDDQPPPGTPPGVQPLPLPPGTPPPYTPPVSPSGPPTTSGDLVLGDSGRFRLSCRFKAPGQPEAPALAWLYEEQSGVFTFFSTKKWEVVVSYWDATTIGIGHRFFISAMTDVAFVLTVRDTKTGAAPKTFENQQGNLLGRFVDFPA